MNKQEVLAKLIQHTNLSVNEFIRQVNTSLNTRSTVSEIAYVLAKLPDDQRNVQGVVKVLVPQNIQTHSTEDTNKNHLAVKVPLSDSIKHGTIVLGSSRSSISTSEANASNTTLQKIDQEQAGGSTKKVPLSTSKIISTLPNLKPREIFRKKNWETFEGFLRSKNVVRLYHFTDFSNLGSITDSLTDLR